MCITGNPGLLWGFRGMLSLPPQQEKAPEMRREGSSTKPWGPSAQQWGQSQGGPAPHGALHLDLQHLEPKER